MRERGRAGERESGTRVSEQSKELQFVAVCCNVLQCVAVCCSVLQCVAVCCSMLQYVAVCCSVLQESGTRASEQSKRGRQK